MTITGPEQDRALIVTVGSRAFAFPLQHVVETMRPLPIEPVVGAPNFIVGVAVVRGAPIPVVDLHALLENGQRSQSYGRFVTLKLGARGVAIGVDGVVGSRTLDSAQLQALPPILGDVPTECIETIGTLDAQLLFVLRAARIVPEAVWKTLDIASGVTR